MWAAIDVLVELEIPFVSSSPDRSFAMGDTHYGVRQIFGHASPFANVPAEVLEKINTCGFGLASTWLPQTEIFKHEASRVFEEYWKAWKAQKS